MRDAFARAAARPRRRLTLVHKHNVLTYAGHLWRRTVDERRARSSPTSTTDYLHVDAATIVMVTDPARFDVVVTDNLFGDIVTDLAAAVTGGIGLAASGNVNPERTGAEHVRAGARLRPGHRRHAASRTRPPRCCPWRCCWSTSAPPTPPPASTDAVAADLAERGRGVRGPRPPSATPSPPGSPERSASVRAMSATTHDVPADLHAPGQPGPGARAAARRDPRGPRLRPALHRPHGARRWTGADGWDDARVEAVRAARSSTPRPPSCTTRRRSSRG